MSRTSVLAFVMLFALGFCFLVYLDDGCRLSGVMTWHGKVCAEAL